MSKVYEMVTEKVTEMLENVNASDWEKPWFAIGQSPINLQGKPYRGINQLLLANSGSNVFGTYKGWQEKGCQVRKGEKSHPVVFWKFFRNSGESQDGETALAGDVTAVMVRYYSVFSGDQVDGEYANQLIEKQKAKLAGHDAISETESFIHNYLRCELLKVKNSDVACYSFSPLTGSEHIEIPRLGQFKTAEHYYSTFLHEIGHSTGNAKRLNRDMGKGFGSKDYAFEELIAELTSAMLSAQLGLSQKPRVDHAQYIKGWLTSLKNDKKFIISAASKAQKAADYITEAAARSVASYELMAVAAE